VMLDLRSGESDVFRPRPDPECAERHRRLPELTPSTVTVDTTAGEALRHLGEEAVLFPPDVLVERANCPEPGCNATCQVGAPAHRWRRDPRCTECGGPWPRAAEQIPSPDLIDGGLTATDPRCELTLKQLGAQPGDVLEVGGGEHGAIQIVGGPDDLFAGAPR